MKNRLTGLLAAAEQGSAELIKDRLREVLGDIRLAEEIIYSANPVVNAILKVKSIKAKEKEIPMRGYNAAPPESIRRYRGHGCSVWESSG